MRLALGVCALLGHAGCRILAAHVIGGRPRITVDRRPRLDWLRAGNKHHAPERDTFAARLGAVQIEWTEQRSAR